eukprot:2933601-Amphidinium_carterae.2
MWSGCGCLEWRDGNAAATRGGRVIVHVGVAFCFELFWEFSGFLLAISVYEGSICQVKSSGIRALVCSLVLGVVVLPSLCVYALRHSSNISGICCSGSRLIS